LDNSIWLFEISRFQTERSETKGVEGSYDALSIVAIWLDINIDIAGETGSAVESQRVTANDHIANAMIVE